MAATLKDRSVAVLTGDVVSSSRLPASTRRRLPEILRNAVDRLKRDFGEAVPFPIDIFRGDSWQLVVVPPKSALRVALFLRGLLHSEHESDRLDTRIAIGIGSADFIPADHVSSGDGDAFRRSGAALEALSRTRRMTVALPPGDTSLPVMVALVDELAKRWTGKQARAACGAMRGLTQEAIGAAWHPRPVSQQAIAQHLEAAGWNAIEEAIDYFEAVVPSLSPEHPPS